MTTRGKQGKSGRSARAHSLSSLGWRRGQGRGGLPAVVEISGLSVRRSNTPILDNVSWRVHKGEHWAILGANGSGKTSLLSAMTGYLTPTSGSICILGRTYGRSDWRKLREEIGLVSSSIRQMMPEAEPAIETVISGKFAMIDLWRKFTPADRARAQRLLRQVECAYAAERPWRVLSQGERQRVLIARALMANPAVLILDEPCAGLDPAAREHFLQFLVRLGAKKTAPTLLLVTHHVEEVMPVFSHVLLLKNGQVLAAGKKADVLTSKALKTAFNTPLLLRHSGGRYQLHVRPAGAKIL